MSAIPLVHVALYFGLVKEYAVREGVTGKLKADNPVEWVARMNEINCRVREIVSGQLIMV